MYRPAAWLRIALVVLIVAGTTVALIYRGALDAATIGDRVDDYVGVIPAAFVVAHLLASLTFVPRTVMAAVAGLLFGMWEGTLWAMTGAMAGALAGFWLARYVASDLVVVEDIPRLGPLLRRAEKDGWRLVLISRLIPVLPNSLVNYALGLTQLSSVAYIVGTALGVLPTTLIFVELGVTGRHALGGGEGWGEALMWNIALLAAAIALPWFIRRRHGS